MRTQRIFCGPKFGSSEIRQSRDSDHKFPVSVLMQNDKIAKQKNITPEFVFQQNYIMLKELQLQHSKQYTPVITIYTVISELIEDENPLQ